MAKFDIRKARPADVLRLINSTRIGTVLSESQLRRHRNMAGYNIGDARCVDLIKYAAWLTWEIQNQSANVAGGYD